ncbi:MAG TPA: phosphotransferase family protein, partial [Ilumatobacteraceae bacterium]|nr:phosphotransferase family protein [Ilumatobacteraceae bacterium]
ARIPPSSADYPVFPRYDMAGQVAAMRLVTERTSAPVPEILWFEDDPSHLGAPFFVMRRIDGVVPPDVLPYSMGGNWLFDATAEQQQLVQDSSIAVLTQIHSIAGDDSATNPIRLSGDASALRRHVDDQYAYYQWVTADGIRAPMIEEGFAYLEQHWPTETDEVLSWGDSRIGNMLYADFRPVAVLDWEMVATGPRELDLGWMIFLHYFFQDLATGYGMPGLPNFMREAEVSATYAQLSGHTPVDLRWYITYAALRHAIIMFRITRRSVRFGESQMPANPDEAFVHHPTLRAMLDGVYFE